MSPGLSAVISSFFEGVTPGYIRGSEISPGGTLELTWNFGDGTRIGHVQGKHPPRSAIPPAPISSFRMARSHLTTPQICHLHPARLTRNSRLLFHPCAHLWAYPSYSCLKSWILFNRQLLNTQCAPEEGPEVGENTEMRKSQLSSSAPSPDSTLNF